MRLSEELDAAVVAPDVSALVSAAISPLSQVANGRRTGGGAADGVEVVVVRQNSLHLALHLHANVVGLLVLRWKKGKAFFWQMRKKLTRRIYQLQFYC